MSYPIPAQTLDLKFFNAQYPRVLIPVYPPAPVYFGRPGTGIKFHPVPKISKNMSYPAPDLAQPLLIGQIPIPAGIDFTYTRPTLVLTSLHCMFSNLYGYFVEVWMKVRVRKTQVLTSQPLWLKTIHAVYLPFMPTPVGRNEQIYLHKQQLYVQETLSRAWNRKCIFPCNMRQMKVYDWPKIHMHMET